MCFLNEWFKYAGTDGHRFRCVCKTQTELLLVVLVHSFIPKTSEVSEMADNTKTPNVLS